MPPSSIHLSHPKYRPDIDGLRALAVLAVVAFHAFPSWVRGGFIGVDIFFVISGYLISTILYENLDKETFSFPQFYARRIRRIFPALILVLSFCFALGWFTLFAEEYKQLGKHIAAGGGFVSNLVLWSEAGYFDAAAETKPLLHLWSLGIEEQFYIIWPLLLWFFYKRKFNLLALTIVFAAFSFALNVKEIGQDAVAAFYSPQTRFWELLCGSILAWLTLYKRPLFTGIAHKIDSLLTSIIYSPKKTVDGSAVLNAISWIGFLALAYGFWRINRELSFPGKWALLPVLGAVLILLAGPHAWVNRTILSNRVAVWIGLISYPLYLWHWPLLSFARIIEGELPSRNIRIAAVMLSIALAWLTYLLVERPLRFGKHSKVKAIALILLMTIIGYVGYNTYERNGLGFRDYEKNFISFSQSIKVPEKAQNCFDIPYAYKKTEDWFCSLGPVGEAPKYFAFGDSHAASLLPALEKFALTNSTIIEFAGTSGCPSVLGIQSMRGNSAIEKMNCRELNEKVFNHVKNAGIKKVILINRWTYYIDSLSRPSEFNPIARDSNRRPDKNSSSEDLFWAIKNTVLRYNEIGVEVIFVQDTPQQLFEPKDILRKGRGNQSEYLKFSVSAQEHQNNQKVVNEALITSGAKIINLDDALCTNKVCPLVHNSKFLYSDDDHLSVEGSLMIYPALSEQLKK